MLTQQLSRGPRRTTSLGILEEVLLLICLFDLPEIVFVSG